MSPEREAIPLPGAGPPGIPPTDLSEEPLIDELPKVLRRVAASRDEDSAARPIIHDDASSEAISPDTAG